MKFEPCEVCKPHNNPGYIFAANGEVTECKCLKTYNNKVKLNQFLKCANVPTKYIGYDIAEYRGEKSKDTVDSINKIITNLSVIKTEYVQFLFHGGPATQKTSVGVHVLTEAAKKGFYVYYITFSSLVEHLKNSQSFRETDPILESKSILEYLKTVDLLLIDDAFNESKIYIKANAYFLPLLVNFFETRKHSSKSYIFIAETDHTHINWGIFGDGLRQSLTTALIPFEFKDTLSKSVTEGKLRKLLGV